MPNINTKIVATLGPATDAPGILKQLMARRGQRIPPERIARHHGGPCRAHRRRARRRRRDRRARGNPARPAGSENPPGPLRKWRLHAGRRAREFTITTEEVLGTAVAGLHRIRQIRARRAGGRPHPAGRRRHRIARRWPRDGIAVRTEVVCGGPIGDNKGINLPGVQVSIPSLTEKDLADLHFGLNAGVDMVALSFVRTADDVKQLRDRLGKRPVTIVAKIEKPEAWDNIEPILDVTDGVMVARGDLGVETALEKVPRIQKSIIRRARRKGRFVITATQMLESMIENSTPTRAEVSDVANAIYDGTDAVMLSAETSKGKYPGGSRRAS